MAAEPRHSKRAAGERCTSTRLASAECLLVQFAREPLPGQVKTRLIPHLSAAQACEIHVQLLRWTTTQLLQADLGAVQLHVAGATDHPVFTQQLQAGVAALVAQSGRDLGERMAVALAAGLQSARKVLLVGSDCPAITPAYLHVASNALEQNELVIGPAQDGGFVLIGLNRDAATEALNALFADVAWGSETVLASTVANAQRLAMRYALLPTLADIDRPGDLAHWEAISGRL